MLALFTLAYGEYSVKKSRVFECHRRFKEGRGVQHLGSGQAKTQRTDTNVDRVRNLVGSDQCLGVRVIAEEMNMNREIVRQIVKEDFGMRNFPQNLCLKSWHMTRNNVDFTFHLIFYAMQRCLIGSLSVMKPGVFNTTWKQNIMQWKTQFTSAEKSTHILVAGQDHPYVFLRSQEDSSLWIHCTRTNGNSTVLFGSADKVTGICSEGKTQTLAW